MYVHYNRTLRNRTKGEFVTTLHAVNSGILKLSKLTPACTVYRGVAGGVLPDQFWKPNEHGVMGGIELGFMSTTTEREVAEMYMKQASTETAKMIFEIRMGMIDRGAVRVAPSNPQRFGYATDLSRCPCRTCRCSRSFPQKRKFFSRRLRAWRWHQFRASRMA